MIRRRARAAGGATPPPGGDVLTVRDARRGALDLGDGEAVVLLGASGQGKTSWLRSLVGVGEPFDTARVLGRPLGGRAAGEVLSWVPETDGVFLSETVWDNVATPRQPAGRPAAATVADALDLVGLADRAAEPVAHLGAGARRRVALARAIARRRPLLVVDGELDPTLWAHWPAMAARLPWLRGTVVAATRADDLAWAASTVALVEGGAVIAQAPLAALQGSADPQVRRVLAWVTP